jgi:hypothetical protein
MAQQLYELRGHFKDAELTIVSICSETTIISASLSQIQHLSLRRTSLQHMLESRADLAGALDTALIGYAVLFSGLQKETQTMNEVAALQGHSTLMGKVKGAGRPGA